MSVVVNEFEVEPAPEQRPAEPEQKPEPPAPPSAADVERLLWMRAERSARLEAS